MKTLKIPTTSGYIDAQAHNEDGCSNLCLTMTSFGIFEITHIDSGRKLFGGFERASSATVELLKIEKCLISIGVDQGMAMNDFQESIMKSDEKFKELSDMTILGYIKFCNSLGNFGCEFQWESEEDSPLFQIERLRKEINK